MPQRPHTHRVEFAFRRALRSLGVARFVAAAARDDILSQWEKGQQRVRMKRGGGFVPNEVMSPARSLNPMRVRSLGRRRHRTALISPLSWRREEAHGLRSSLPQAGESLRISLGTGPRFVGDVASEGCPCRDEGASRAPDLARHEAASLFHRDSSLTMLTPKRRDLRKMDAALWRR